MQGERQLRRPPANETEAKPEQRESANSPPFAVDDHVLGRKDKGCHEDAETRLNPLAPGELLRRRQDAGQRRNFAFWRVRWWLIRPVAQQRASKRVADQDQRDAKPQSRATTPSARWWRVS